MIWIVAYLVVAACFAVYTPITQARGRARLADLTASNIAAMDERDRKLLNKSAGVLKTDYNMVHLTVGSLLWPVNVVLIVVVEIYFLVRRQQ